MDKSQKSTLAYKHVHVHTHRGTHTHTHTLHTQTLSDMMEIFGLRRNIAETFVMLIARINRFGEDKLFFEKETDDDIKQDIIVSKNHNTA